MFDLIELHTLQLLYFMSKEIKISHIGFIFEALVHIRHCYFSIDLIFQFFLDSASCVLDLSLELSPHQTDVVIHGSGLDSISQSRFELLNLSVLVIDQGYHLVYFMINAHTLPHTSE